ncbi:MAG: PqqD family protein [Gemmatimonas sp.]
MTRFEVSTPAVVSEIIDGEAVIMNLDTGHYFSTRGTGAVVWSCMERGVAQASIAQAIAAHYGISSTDAGTALVGFTNDLLQHGLIRNSTRDADAALAAELQWPAPWAAPVVEVFTDMEDLLLLDPIHDVGEAGWPMPAEGFGIDKPAA